MIGLFIDPGNEQSAWLFFDGIRPTQFGIDPNTSIIEWIGNSAKYRADVLVIEQVASFGMPVGAEVFETVFWSGRFAQAWPGSFLRLKRHEVKTHLCHSQRATDATIRQALIDRFGPGREKAIGTKNNPGPLYGISKDVWSALALAVTWFDQNAKVAA